VGKALAHIRRRSPGRDRQAPLTEVVKDVKSTEPFSRSRVPDDIIARVSIRKPSLMVVLIVILAALVPLLGVLQYRWLGQVSEAERERMRAGLETAVRNFADDFDRELTAAHVDLQVESYNSLPHHASSGQTPDNWLETSIHDYPRRYERWRAQAKHPQLVKEVYLIRPGRELLLLDPGAQALEPAEWPPELAAYRERFDHELPADRGALSLRGIDTLIDEVPTLLIPIPDVRFPAGGTGLTVIGPQISFPGFVLVVLDGGFIKEQLLPELASRYFSVGEPDYKVEVIGRGDPSNIIYRSDTASPAQDPGNADATASLFRVRFQAPIEDEKSGNGSDAGNAGTRVLAGGARMAVQVFSHQLVRPDQSDPGKNLDARITLMGTDSGKWQVLATHRAGSLDAAVALVRRRNLAVSFGILLLLSISVGMIVISTRRANRFAAQQIEFVAGVSHELRTPLAVICSAAENLADGVIEESSQVRSYGELIEAEGRRLTDMVEQTLEYAGVQSGKRGYTLQPIAVDQLIDDAVVLSQSLLDENSVRVEREVEPLLPAVEADRAAISRALQNLISNAVKYRGDERWVRIEARRDLTGGSPTVLISVVDRGRGIDATEIGRIFEPFYRGRDVVAAQIHGSGLGLNLVRHIAEAHGGTVLAESEQGRGSRFTLRLPVAKTERTSP
jgi:signal transduction histidine kinase